ncbi:PIN domain-containing protein [Neorhizobium sp. JUb45]|uniref:PIN domain-containing protein n=1 Tax=unclassified Neorhizobium TaxID=2629175 RepID=UPI0010DE2191|nr:PIN domain-containing protein [Neorhizobium sp. JUb45]TCR06391.1 putative nucleic acid-binding protein [Neorhizobium sp. JUb45]
MVVDANVVLSAMRSSAGASHLLLREMLVGKAPFAVSPAVAFEYEDLLKREGIFGDEPWIRPDEIDTVLDALFSQAYLVSPWFRFRPFLSDPKDDIYIECALTAEATFIVTHDRHFRHPAVRAFGMTVVRPADFLAELMTRRQPK